MWESCREWFARRDGLPSEIHVLDVPEASVQALIAAVRRRAEIVAVFGRQGIESFAAYGWMDDSDDDVLMSTFFIAVMGGVRLQHFLAPARPVRQGPWLAVGQGAHDLEIAFWPDEVFGRGDEDGPCPSAFADLLGYARDLAGETGAGGVCLTHGLEEGPRSFLDRGIASVPGFLLIKCNKQ